MTSLDSLHANSDGLSSCYVPAKIDYKYKPLDLQRDSIRLVRLLPELSAGGCLRFDIWHSNLPAEYRCVSYRWGERTRQHKIMLDGRMFSVGDNLHSFLREALIWTQRGYSDPLWIDAICIDQSCIVERGHQVQRMGRIYSEAQEVFVWLGDHGELVNAFHDWVHTANRRECPAHLREQWDMVRFNPYWSRAWIRQEILLAKTVTVVLRGARIEWTVLGSAVARYGDLDRVDHEHAAHLWSFWGERWRKKESYRSAVNSSSNSLFSFWSLMQMHRTSDCTDRRDRVYSLLGLIDEKHDFTVDYEESAADLFWRVGEHLDAWQPELVDILKAALLEENSDEPQHCHRRDVIDPQSVIESVQKTCDMRIRIPIRRISAINSLACHFQRSVKCEFRTCKQAPRLRCTHDDLLICTNAPSDEPTEHGCIHAIAHRLDVPAAELFEIRIVAHHGEHVTTTTLLSTAVQVFDVGTESWVGISTWSSLQKALRLPDMDRYDRLKLSVPASYAIWIWFGWTPNQLEEACPSLNTKLPSVHHALPSGTKIKERLVELAAIRKKF